MTGFPSKNCTVGKAKLKGCEDKYLKEWYDLDYFNYFKTIFLCFIYLKKIFFSRLEKPQLFEEARAEYLKDRNEFQHSYVETGQKKKMGRKESAFWMLCEYCMYCAVK